MEQTTSETRNVYREHTNYASKPDREPMTEEQKRWLSWQFKVNRGQRKSFSGVELTEAERAKKVQKRKAQKIARKANRK